MFVTHKLTDIERRVLHAALGGFVAASRAGTAHNETAKRLRADLDDGGGCPVPRVAVDPGARTGVASDCGADTYGADA